MKHLFSLILFSASIVFSFGQTGDFGIYELPSGELSSIGNVHAVYRDKEGYMWYSTEEGLCRYNGYQVDVFCSDSISPSLLASNFVFDIGEDNDNHLWFGTASGTYILDKRDFKIHPIAAKEAAGVECEALIALSDGTVWISTWNYILHLDSNERLLQKIATGKKPNSGKYANSFFEDSQNNLWLLEKDGTICRYDKGSRRFLKYKWDGASPQRMIEDSQHGCYWVATWGGGIYRFKPNTLGTEASIEQQLPTVGSNASKSEVIDLIMDKSHPLLWVTSMDGLHAYDVSVSGLSERNISGLLPAGKNIVDRMDYDNRGNVWVAAFSPHTFIISSAQGRVRRNKMPDVLQTTGNSVIVDFAISDGEDCIWIWDPRIGLELHNRRTGHVSLASAQADDASMHGSGVITPITGEQAFWMASGNDIVRLWHEGDVIRREKYATIPNAGIFGLFDASDGYIWAATTRGVKKILKSDPSKIVQVTDSADVAYRIAVDKDGNYFCHSEQKGIYAFLSKGRKEISLLGSDEHCSSMTFSGSTLWIGTDRGRVYRYTPGDSAPASVLPLGNKLGNRLLDIKVDGKGHVWSIASQIIKEWNPANGASHTVLGNDSFVDMDYFRTMASCGDSIFIGGSMGYCMIESSEQLADSTSDAVPRVSAVSIDGKKEYIGVGNDEISISPSAGIVEISVTTLDYLHVSQIQYAYRLCKIGFFGGADNSGNWEELPRGVNVLRFTSLDKGEYVLQLKATDPNGMWGPATDGIRLHRQPAWWETWWAYLAYLAMAIAITVWVLKRYSNYVRKKRMDQMEEKLTEMKFKFFTNISHELRTPLTLIMLPLENMLKKSDSFSSADRKRIESMHSNAKELLEMINQLLDFRRMELGEAQLNVKSGNIVDFINTAIETFQLIAARKHINLSFNKPSKSLYINFDHEKLHHVIWNLLSNAMKFSKEGGNVTVGLEQKDSDKIEISVSDTGIGIAPEHLSHIFERYYQASDSHAEGGSGIGLHMVSELIHMHGGDVTVDSELGKGTTFRFTLPMNLPLSQVHTIAQPEPGETAADEYDSAVGGENKILLVEDNVEFRTMMAESLGEDGYSTLEAGNGEEALVLLKNHEVSLVISDVMMPVMNGFDLCRKIKSDLTFSHIPVILLTAKTGDENQLEGYKMGADYYMTKPFSMDLLMNRISHLGAQRAQQQEAFQHEQENDVVGITRSKIDEEFLEKAINVMNDHIGDPAFNVETFSQEMFTSRMTLYRKITNITGQSPNEFITTIRLKHAAQLLKETSASVAVISEQCGFSSPSYFSKNFKKMFGKLPKEYRMR